MKRVVIKLGTNTVTRDSGVLDLQSIRDLVDQSAAAYKSGWQVVIVSSGAVGAGLDTLIDKSQTKNSKSRVHSVTMRQAAAAIGQVDLIAIYKRMFAAHGIEIAQTLLTRGVLTQRLGYLNVRDTMEMLLQAGIVPIANENDVVAVEELVGVIYGDNDRLSAMIANALNADLLLLLGEMNGLHTSDPHLDPEAELISEVGEVTDEIRMIAAGPLDRRGSGGMKSKLEAADMAMRSGMDMVIADGRVENVVNRLLAGERIGTLFRAKSRPAHSRKRWILTGRTEAKGELTVDDGAVRALRENGYSLLPAGIVHVRGKFERGDIISVISVRGDSVAWGVCSYSAEDVRVVMGKNTRELPRLLDHCFGNEVIHRDNMALA